MQFVPYRGGTPLNHDLAPGHIDFTWAWREHLFAGAHRADLELCLMTKGHWWTAPGVPTTEEAGIRTLRVVHGASCLA